MTIPSWATDAGTKKCFGLVLNAFHRFVIVSRFVMEEREAFDPGFLRHVDGHVDGAVTPALARFGA